MAEDRYGQALLAAQAAAGALLAWPGRRRWPVPRSIRRAGWFSAAGGAAAMAAAAANLGSDLRALPEPKQGATLRRDGLYRYVRHPLYAGLLTLGAGVAAARGRPEPVVGAVALAGILHVKADYEESLLRARFGSDYDVYAATTPRLVPRLVVGAGRGDARPRD